MPNADLFLNASQVTWDDYLPLLKYQILTNADLTGIFQVNEELASRIRSAVRSVATVDELVDKVATKRYTKARVRRILAYILVGAVEKPLPEAVHVLGFTPKEAGTPQNGEKICGYRGSNRCKTVGCGNATSRSSLCARKSTHSRAKLGKSSSDNKEVSGYK